MSEADAALKGIKRAARKRAQADKARSEATADLRRYCRKAQKAKVPVIRIAKAAGLPVRAFTTCWRSDPSQVGVVELAFGRDGDFEALGSGLLSVLWGHRGEAEVCGSDSWRTIRSRNPNGIAQSNPSSYRQASCAPSFLLSCLDTQCIGKRLKFHSFLLKI
jgi:hypothetical protein